MRELTHYTCPACRAVIRPNVKARGYRVIYGCTKCGHWWPVDSAITKLGKVSKN